MAKKLTPATVESYKAGTARREIPDGGCAALYLVIQTSGLKSWAVRFRQPANGKNAKMTLGKYPLVTLHEAHTMAVAAMGEVAAGRDPRDAKRRAKIAAGDREADTVAVRAQQFIEQYAKKRTRPNSWKATEGLFRRDVLPIWGDRSVHDIRRKDVIDMVERVAETRPVQANRLLMALSRFFRWLLSRDVILASPVIGVAMPSDERSRDRALSDPEIVRLVQACDTLPEPYGDVFRLLLLLGSRRSEVSHMERSEVDEAAETWTLPKERSKNGVARTIPLSKQALEIIKRQPRTSEIFVFAKRNHFPEVKAILDKAMKPDAPWRTHDLRRVFASNMQRLGISVQVVEKLLNHTAGTFAGVTGVYQKYEYRNEMAVALQRWADHIDALVKGESTEKVVEFRRG
jgi:integrase